ncbi:hypothetical protein Kpol_495p18 [Vanderwaltozyma polyspora DSM 70294]|uniref:Uncharacterized protein n=1 Tax=Vanderwaltozyma polyspora (strain ATCC 22028 / DSM 70294 / BCRC 21397 / CBS 2163 / NBRC 10782 / NRRL Y-8283 / UCD 57-17) TaxID=436907 RepID=A7TNZ5_VANPO|nr:uncharacterized protein Kpol_495p18 [Vanderwaltozyma polyspora DSM 70294]EDO16020.1 hypothetical protein Kpol_495p18 [Vanderwaltozyma polyspora DSM 70294]
MNSYRDSYYQFQHFDESFHCLYYEWNRDEFPLTEEEIGGDNGQNSNLNVDNNVDGNNVGINNSGVNGNTSNHPKNTNGTNGNGDTLSSNQAYWDYFHDEEDWELFKGMQLDSNGVVTFNFVNEEIDFNCTSPDKEINNFDVTDPSNTNFIATNGIDMTMMTASNVEQIGGSDNTFIDSSNGQPVPRGYQPKQHFAMVPDTITGSIFNRQRGVIRIARQQNSSWKDWTLR